MKRLLLTILVGMFVATGLSAKALGQGKMKVSIAAGYTIGTFKNDVKMHKIDLAQETCIAFLSPQASGLGFSYGLTKDLDLMYTMPIFSMKLIGMPSKDTTTTRVLGTPLLGVIWHKDLGAIGLRVAPYLGAPFVEILGKTVTVDGTDKDIDLGETNFKQQTLTGVTMAIDSKMKGKIFWQGWLNLQAGFGGDIDMTMTSILSGLIGYKLGKGKMTKIHLFWITPNLLAKDTTVAGVTVKAPGFVDGGFKIKVVYGMKLNKTSGIHAGLWTKMGFTELSKQSTLGESTFMGGLTLDYWVKF